MSRRAIAAHDTELTALCGVFDLLHDAVIVADADGPIRYANTSAGHLFGYGPSELHSRSLNELIPARFRRRHERVLRELTQTGQPRPIGERHRRIGLGSVTQDVEPRRGGHRGPRERNVRRGR